MKTLIGLGLLVIAVIGYLYFGHYKGIIIPYPWLWWLLAVLLGLFGIWMIASAQTQAFKVIEHEEEKELAALKKNGEKIELDYACCEFKGNNYSVPNNLESGPNAAPFQTYYNSMYSSNGGIIREEIRQSALIYNHKSGDNVERFVSTTFPFDETTLQFYVLNKNITLYVDRFNRKKFFFDFKE